MQKREGKLPQKTNTNMKDKKEKLNALYDYIEEQKDRADINEDAHNILQDIQDRLGEIIYN